MAHGMGHESMRPGEILFAIGAVMVLIGVIGFSLVALGGWIDTH